MRFLSTSAILFCAALQAAAAEPVPQILSPEFRSCASEAALKTLAEIPVPRPVRGYTRAARQPPEAPELTVYRINGTTLVPAEANDERLALAGLVGCSPESRLESLALSGKIFPLTANSRFSLDIAKGGRFPHQRTMACEVVGEVDSTAVSWLERTPPEKVTRLRCEMRMKSGIAAGRSEYAFFPSLGSFVESGVASGTVPVDTIKVRVEPGN